MGFSICRNLDEYTLQFGQICTINLIVYLISLDISPIIGYKFCKGWQAIATLKPTFTFLVGILPSKSIEYGKIPTKNIAKKEMEVRLLLLISCFRHLSKLYRHFIEIGEHLSFDIL